MQHNLVQGTPKVHSVSGPILWRVGVTLDRRNARKGVGSRLVDCLRYVLIPRANRVPMSRPDSRNMGRVGFQLGRNCCDALRCSGPHARYTDRTSEFFPWPEGRGNLVKLGRDGDRALQLLLFNEEYLVSVSHQLALNSSLPF